MSGGGFVDPNEFDDEGMWADDVEEEEEPVVAEDGFVEVGGGAEFDASKHVLKVEEDAMTKKTNASLDAQGELLWVPSAEWRRATGRKHWVWIEFS